MRKLVSFCAAAAIVAGVAALLASAPASAAPPPRCYLEPGSPGCPPCTQWDSHKCACVRIPACKV